MTMIRMLPIAALSILLAGCVTTPDPTTAGGYSYTRIGREILVDGPRVTPLAILEDSRCPENARCVWAGRVRINARIAAGRGVEEREITLGQPIPIVDGQLLLGDVQPSRKTTEAAVSPGDYRFGFRFDGGY